MVSQRFVVISITACAAEHYAAWPRVLVSRLSLSSLLQMQQRVLAPLYIWWWWLPQRIVASLKRSGWGIWSGTTNLDAGRGGVRAAARELLERLYIAWWRWPTQLVSFWKKIWAGPNNIRANNAGVPWPTPRRRRQQPWPGAAMHLKRRRRLTAGTHHFDRASRSTL